MSEDKLSIPAEKVMRAPPVTVQFSDNVMAIVERMITNDIGAVIVMMGGKPIGIVTERDVLERVMRAGGDPRKTLAKDIMSAPIRSIESDKPLSEALRTMRDKRIRRLAVVKDGRLIGLMTERRILNALC